MIYTNEDGQVLHSFVHSKKILDIYMKLCKGQSEVLEEAVKYSMMRVKMELKGGL